MLNKKHIDNICLLAVLVLLLSNNFINQLLLKNFLLIPIFILLYVVFRVGKEIKNQYYLLIYILLLFLIVLFYHNYYPLNLPIIILVLTIFTILYKKFIEKLELKKLSSNYLEQKKVGFVTNINLGSGVKWVRDGWISIDKCHEFTNDKRVLAIDAIKGDLLKHFDNNSIDSIYTSHTLEHFTSGETKKVLSDCYKILRPNAIIRIVVPDLDICIEKFYEKDYEWWKNNRINPRTDNMNKLKMTNYLMRSIGANQNWFDINRENINTIRGTHFSTYNFDLLNKILLDIGFSKVEHLKFNKCTEIFNGLDNREKCSLHIEAIK